MDAGELLAKGFVTLRLFPGTGIEGGNAVIKRNGYIYYESPVIFSDYRVGTKAVAATDLVFG